MLPGQQHYVLLCVGGDPDHEQVLQLRSAGHADPLAEASPRPEQLLCHVAADDGDARAARVVVAVEIASLEERQPIVSKIPGDTIVASTETSSVPAGVPERPATFVVTAPRAGWVPAVRCCFDGGTALICERIAVVPLVPDPYRRRLVETAIRRRTRREPTSLSVPRLTGRARAARRRPAAPTAIAACVATSSRPVRAAVDRARAARRQRRAGSPRDPPARAHINAPIPEQARMVT